MPFRRSNEGGYCVFQLGPQTEILLVNKLSSLFLTLESNKRKEKIRGVTGSKIEAPDKLQRSIRFNERRNKFLLLRFVLILSATLRKKTTLIFASSDKRTIGIVPHQFWWVLNVKHKKTLNLYFLFIISRKGLKEIKTIPRKQWILSFLANIFKTMKYIKIL